MSARTPDQQFGRFQLNPTPHRRILHLIFSSRIAGSERYCADLANRQAAMGHEVHVACAGKSPLQHALVPAIRLHPLPFLFRGYFLQRLISRLNPDLCHAHLSAACKALGRIQGSHKSLATLHVGYKPHQHRKLDGLICVNHAQSGRLGDYPGIVRTIPNWLPASPTVTPAGIREELGISADTFLVGAVGRLHPSKGMDVLVEAFRQWAPANAQLVVVGEGPQRRLLEKLRGNDPRIHLVGYRPIVHGCLRDLNLFVSPSREESFGLAIVEAMGVGLPIISTLAEGPAEYLRSQPATLIEPASVGALIQALAHAHAQFQSGALGRVAYDLSAFDPASRIASIMDFYTHVLESEPLARQAPAEAQRRLAVPA